MKKQFKIIVLFLVGSLLLTSCSSNDDSTSSSQFMVDGQSFNLLPGGGILEVKMDNVHTEQGQTFDRSSIGLNGVNGSTIATVVFDLFYKDGLPVEGVYNIAETLDDYEDHFYSLLLSQQKQCLGWTTACTISQVGTTFSLNANNPSGTVTVTNNGNNNYRIQYNGNFREYSSDFQLGRNVPVIIDITSDVVTP